MDTEGASGVMDRYVALTHLDIRASALWRHLSAHVSPEPLVDRGKPQCTLFHQADELLMRRGVIDRDPLTVHAQEHVHDCEPAPPIPVDERMVLVEALEERRGLSTTSR
jgi:hypothetical protein